MSRHPAAQRPRSSSSHDNDNTPRPLRQHARGLCMQALSIVNCRKHRTARPDRQECCACWSALWVAAGCIGAMEDAPGSGRKVPGKGRGGDQCDGYRLTSGNSDGRPVGGRGEVSRVAGGLAWRPALRLRLAAAPGGVSRAGGTARATAWVVARAGHAAAGNDSAG
jgi:hypothetical protein